MTFAPKMRMVGLALALVVAACLTAVASNGTRAYFSDTVSGVISGTIGTTQNGGTTYAVTATAGSGGTVSPSSQTVNSGDDATVTIAPRVGYHIATLLVDSVSVDPTGTVVFSSVSGTHTVSATFAINTYTLSYTAGLGGSIGGSATQVVNYGADGTAVTATPATGYHFVSWSDNGSTVAARQDTVVKANVSATANFEAKSYTISFVSTGTAVPAITQPFGSAVTAPAAPTKTGYIFGGWNTSAGVPYTFTTMPASNITLYATWIKTYTITFDSEGGSSVAPITQPYGSAVTAPTAPTKAGYTFAGWYSNSCLTTPHTFTTMPASNITLYAKWTVSTYTITVTQGSNGTICPGTTTVNYGATQTFQITAKCGYQIVAVAVDGKSVGAVSSYTFSSVTANHTITATFAASTFAITVTQGSNGTISPGTTSVNCAAAQTFQITPNTGYHVVAVTVDGRLVGAVSTYTFTSVSANHTITATFAASTFAITVTQGSNGTISPGTTNVNCGCSATFRITANTGYHVSALIVDGVSVPAQSSYTFSSVTANHAITPTFAINTFVITVTQGSNGTISPGTTSVNYGAAQAFQIAPNAGYHVVAVTVDGRSVGALSAYTFSSVSANHTICATFAVNTATIAVSQGSNGTISPGTTTLNCGAAQTFQITPKSGYHTVAVTVDGSSVGAVSSYTFAAVTANHTITATFAKNPRSESVSSDAIELSDVEEPSPSSKTSATAQPPTGRTASVPVPRPELSVTVEPTVTPEPNSPENRPDAAERAK